MLDNEQTVTTTAPNTSINSNNSSLQPSLIHISEILQHSIELKLCSSVSTHNVFWDTLFHGIENNQEAISMIISLLLTKYIQLANNEKSKGISLIQALYSKITNSNIILTHEEITNILSGKSSQQQNPDDQLQQQQQQQQQQQDDDEDDEDFEKSPLTPISPALKRSLSGLQGLESLSLDSDNSSNNNNNNNNINETNNSLSSSPTPTPIIDQKNEMDINSEEYKENEIIKSSILSTITFLAMNYNFNSNFPALKLIMIKFNDLMEKSKPDYIIQSELSRILSSGFKDSNEFIFFLLDQSADLIQVSDNAKQQRNSWFNSFVRDLLSSSITKSKMVFDNLFLFLKHPLLMEKRMLYFLQMLKHYLLVTPVISPQTITAAMSIVKNYFLWPKPYCDFARELLEILSIEEKCPGSYFRSVLSLEVPSLSLYTNTLSGGQSTNIGGALLNNQQQQQQQLKQRPSVHMLIDRYNSEALIIQELFESNSRTYLPNTSQLQVNNIANIYYRVMGIDNSSIGLEFLDQQQISQFHFKILDLMNKTIYFEESESKPIRIKELAALRDDIVKTVQSNTSQTKVPRYYPQQITLPNLHYQFHSINRISIRNKKPDEYGSPYQIPLYKKTMTSLMSLFSAYQDQDFHTTCKLVIVGNDSLIQHVLGTYVYLKHQSTYLFNDLDVQFYIIPAGASITTLANGGTTTTTSQCKFSEYLASFDSWYYRQSCLIIRSLYNIIPTFSIYSLLPQTSDQSFLDSISLLHSNRNSTVSNPPDLDDLNSNTNSNNNNYNNNNNNNNNGTIDYQPLIKTPSSVIQSEAEYLFREATFRIDIPIMKCECWSDDLYYTIPFLMKAELNLNTFLQSQGEGLNLDQNQLNKIATKFVPFNICTKFQQVGQTEASVIESKVFNDITIQNVYPKSLNINNAQQLLQFPPPKPLMELTLTEEKKKKMDRYSFNIDTMEVELSDKKKFDILLDGQLIGPVNRINISFCTLKPTFDKNNKMEQQYIYFPIMTYLPNF
ncbi:hypothetical protein DLAC_05341 [Tieghemostelium lacteum]|uniref:Uncharacterized protein n=1 Tax=Tieghemostelium lacteum TaxID=361077 RepID=A0A151ZFX1_TIELA|nr:hypothetical protein DLAC_05341 [Tieghemostelium lacteum]|eukprot:KYQ92764.1 hypothetical protein DLAC_05341 [Tieghemostelium lacteum]